MRSSWKVLSCWRLLLGSVALGRFVEYDHDPLKDDANGDYKDDHNLINDMEDDATTTTTTLSLVEHGQRQIEWIRSMGGFVSSKIEIRSLDPNDDNAPLGVFAITDIEEGDLLLSIPRHCLITSESDNNNEDLAEWICPTAYNLVRELELGEASFYAPYVSYLNAQPFGQLPSMWSPVGQDLLLRITGGSLAKDDQIIPPLGPVGWLDEEWRTECRGGDDPLEQHAFLLVIQRGWDDILVPILDLLSHRNGYWYNTVSNSIRHDLDDDVELMASRPIQAGEELYHSYTHCTDCGGRAETYGTPEVLRDYGFVESYPQKFVFQFETDQTVAFSLDQVDEEDGELELMWHSPPPDASQLSFFEEQLERLKEVYSKYLRYRNDDVHPHELFALRQFCQAYIMAFARVIEIARGDSCAVGTDAAANGTCSISSSMRYSPLNETYDEYDDVTCDKDVSLDFSKYDTVDEIQSQYQLGTYIHNPENMNTCFDLDDIYQICGSYRPHYHEMMVHYTARFLPKIQRVLWVGGGDSMLLHEIIKYPELEFVIGLELDQTVTRWSFKHFGSQPRWDNDKVQWWYGDAAKSLLMLPKEYFGTFDMILVDLSETVMSSLVTKELDIMAALSLLLRPEGIFVKNELYFEKLNPIFKHTIQVHYYDVPVVCSQCLCLGSNGVDFIERQLTDHKILTMFAPLDKIDQEFDLVHDYLTNPNAQRHCATDEEEEELLEQESSPGTLMIVEVEDTSAELEPARKVESLVWATLRQEGLSIISSIATDEFMGSVLVVVMEEGYVAARTWPENNYCAFDIHLWSSFEKHERIKKALVAAVGSETRSVSSFRIVAGGMFGRSTWREDYKQRGPKFTQDCSDPVGPELIVPVVQTVVDDILNEIMGLNHQTGIVAVVVCGRKEQECPSLDVVSRHASIRQAFPLFACPILPDNVEYLEDSGNLMFSCENELLEKLIEAEDRISTFVLDPSATFPMAQILNRIAKRAINRKTLFTSDMQVIAPIMDKTETWRKHFVDEFRDVIPLEPAFMADLLFNSTESCLEVTSFLSGDEHFIANMKSLRTRIEQRTGLVGEIRAFGGGGFKFQEDFKASQWFLPGDYDQRTPYIQWHSQQPTGHQSIFQLEFKAKGEQENEEEEEAVIEVEQKGGKEKKEDEQPAALSKEIVKGLLIDTLSAHNMSTIRPVEEYSNIGDGSVLVAVFYESLGHVITLFDGRSHISLNIFTYQESTEFAQSFADHFKTLNDALDIVLFDEMPRGFGRVVNFLADIEPRHEPHWALDMME